MDPLNPINDPFYNDGACPVETPFSWSYSKEVLNEAEEQDSSIPTTTSSDQNTLAQVVSDEPVDYTQVFTTSVDFLNLHKPLGVADAYPTITRRVISIDGYTLLEVDQYTMTAETIDLVDETAFIDFTPFLFKD